ncbi:MAG: hypothetical protein GKS00_00670 [Alphaproteobacteria bacterium]|nr:hypothetical protein [Alphaproteobacteria bacterium]
MAYETIEVRPIAGALGAEVSGVDLTDLGNQAFSEIHRAFLDHQVLYFQDQPLDDDQLEELTLRFGPFGDTPFVEGMPGHPNIIEVRKDADEVGAINFGGRWHSDFSFQEAPPSMTLLHSRVTPPAGGDTLYTDMYGAYEALSPGMKEMLKECSAVHSARRSYGTGGRFSKNPNATRMTVHPSAEGDKEMAHPIVRTHPETGRKALFVNAVYTVRLEDMTEAESAPILDYLYEHSTRPEFTCRIRWSENALAIWDNRCTQHYAINDYHGHARLMHRTTCAGDRPV